MNIYMSGRHFIIINLILSLAVFKNITEC